MSLILNSNTISKLVFNGVLLSQVVFNSVPIWSSQIGIFFMGLRFRTSTTETVRLCTRIDSDGNLVGTENQLSTGRSGHAGTSSGNNAMFFGGAGGSGNDLLTIVNKEGSEVKYEYITGTEAASGRSGATIDNTSLFFGSSRYNPSTGTTTIRSSLTRFNTAGTVLSNTNSISGVPSRANTVGMSFNDKVSFYGGSNTSSLFTELINMNSDGVVIDSLVNLGRTSSLAEASSLGNRGLIFGGIEGATISTPTINKMLILENNAIVSDNNTLGTARRNHAGCSIGPVATFYGGYTGSSISTMTNLVSRFDSSGTLVGPEHSLGSQTRADLAAASAS